MNTEGSLARSFPEAFGIDGRALTAAVDAVSARGFDLHSIMIAVGGRVVAEKWWWPATPDQVHMLHSATKSFVGTAVGLALAEDRLALDEAIIDILGDDGPLNPDLALSRVHIVDLLTMRGGNGSGISGATSRLAKAGVVRSFLAEPVLHEPGTAFTYSSASSHLLSAAVQRRTGQRVVDYLRPRLFEPLGIPLPMWDTDPEGVSTGGNGMRLRTEDFLKFGQLHLDGGLWGSRQVLPAEWVSDATHMHVPSARSGTWNGSRLITPEAGQTRRGYGYQFWVEPSGVYYASGVFGQFCIVHPRANAVVAVTAGVDSRRPGLFAALESELFPLLENPGGVDVEVARGDIAGWQAMSRTPPVDRNRPSLPKMVGTFVAAANEHAVERIEILSTADSVCLVFVMQDRRDLLRAARNAWTAGVTSLYGADLHHSYTFVDEPVVSYARSIDNGLELELWFPETAFRDRITVHFTSENSLTIARSTNANSGRLRHEPLHARRIDAR